VSTTARHPEYVGGPLCGDPVTRPEERGVTVSRPKIGKTHQGRGTHVYRRGDGYDQLYAGEELP
jgi:hypothetical protein